ncbi:MAG: type III secretion protein U [Glomeribacter sp. 1016415]|uniref:Type III secretion inner membrane protein SctU n=1 Tax=Mycoavidus cysteinexigens TaxID=1553431 RepID=A0A2Z6EU39_9BURK|nr:type III secretion system export apparatus subunit SctU [Mycoavidus cysteinexigens]MCX8565414.1 type III secretion protein U [Glomeribacter sp. 1016415]BBE08928.1 Type III secretion inner membrane protein SctU [Mycoavidus cysteinexigens]GAM52349.1 flagellar biosynthesis protein FlhB [bacterium endosymbiont of Mortierella elongata FMR23-6]GLR01228.1 type III secretion system protein HrcU [Mycoavidus cysteinexigens]
MSEEKNQEPTDKRLRDARERGDVYKSTDLTGAVTLCVTLLLLMSMQPLLSKGVQGMVMVALDFIDGDRNLVNLMIAVQKIGIYSLYGLLPFLLFPVLTAILTLLPQVGFGLSFEPVTPNFDALNPGNGLQRMFSLKTVLELVRSLLKAALIVFVMWKAILMVLPLIAASIAQPLITILQVSWQVLLKVCAIAAGLFLVIGLLDLKLQIWLFMRKHRMSETEIKNEYKEMEGDPHIKAERKAIAREIAFSPSLKKAIKSSNAVLVNPTHYAVAIQYAPKEHGLPLVVAKGMDASAALIRKIAREEGVPIISNPPLARALYKIQLQSAVPEELFEVVAAILRWVDGVAAKRNVTPSIH